MGNVDEAARGSANRYAEKKKSEKKKVLDIRIGRDHDAQLAFADALLSANDNMVWMVAVWRRGHSAIQPFSHSAIQPFSHSAIQPFSHSAIHPFSSSAIQAFSQSTMHPLSQQGRRREPTSATNPH